MGWDINFVSFLLIRVPQYFRAMGALEFMDSSNSRLLSYESNLTYLSNKFLDILNAPMCTP